VGWCGGAWKVVQRTADTEADTEARLKNARAAEQIELALSKKGWSREELAEQASLSISTINKGMSGERPFSRASLLRIADALGLDLLAPGPGISYQASDDLGAYPRSLGRDYVGDYVTLRPSFFDARNIVAYCTTIVFGGSNYLAFEESERTDKSYCQKGKVALPPQTGFAYLVTNERGQHRLAILRRLIDGELYGMLLALRSGAGGHLTPLATPYALVPINLLAKPSYGTIREGHPDYDRYQRHLTKLLSEGYAAFAG
jgi:transcriptional regulator with XRE-family HTH domain